MSVRKKAYFEVRIDFPKYAVLVKSNGLTYVIRHARGAESHCPIPTGFTNTWNWGWPLNPENRIPCQIQIKHGSDNWGMRFRYQQPMDLQGMFDFIAKGYNIWDNLQASCFAEIKGFEITDLTPKR